MEPATCRPATLADVAEMARIRDAGGWEGGAGAERMARYLAGEHHPQQALAPRVIYVAEAGGAMAGFIAGHLTTRFGCDGELQWIFVLPGLRGAGIADGLFDRLAAWFAGRGARRVCVNVEPDNPRARTFYARRGALPMHPYWMVWDDITAATDRTSAPGECDG
ncbi:MAG: GNAT family N-acetyltransferase [Longimicrobiaceae bacterium]